MDEWQIGRDVLEIQFDSQGDDFKGKAKVTVREGRPLGRAMCLNLVDVLGQACIEVT